MHAPSVETIEGLMDGLLREAEPGRQQAYLPSRCVQNHAAFLSRRDGRLSCVWFGGSLEGKSDVCIWRADLTDGRWGEPRKLTDDPERSEQNPVLFVTPDRRTILLHTAQPGGNQDACVVRVRTPDGETQDAPVPVGTFIRSPMHVRSDGAWLLPAYRCIGEPGRRWTGSHDTAAVAISKDAGISWRLVPIPRSIGCVHTTLVPLGGKRWAAFFRRRQADFVHRAESVDGAETWSAPQATDLPNNNSSIALDRLAAERIVMACNPVNAAMHPSGRRTSLYDEIENDDRPNAAGGCQPIWGVPRAPMVIALSEDEGRSFPDRIVIDDGQGACLSNNSLEGNNSELSYPTLCVAPDGSIDLAYTFHRRAIKHVRLTSGWLAERIGDAAHVDR